MTYAGKIPQTLLGLLLLGNLISCTQTPTHPQSTDRQSTGSISFRLAFPPISLQNQTGFSLKAIPAGTRSFEIHISGAGLTEPKTVKITATAGESQKTHSIGDLPTGPKQVRVTAFDENKALATASQEVMIVASQTTRAEFDLRSALFALEVKLPRDVPVAIPVQATVTGDNILGSGLALTSHFPSGGSSLTLADLPAGKKELALRVQFSINNQTLSSEPIRKEVTGQAGESASIEISLNEIANALVPTLLKQNLADLPNLLNQIPPDLVEILRSNALLAALLNNRPSPVPSPVSTPTPEPSPTPSPAATAVPQDLKLEILDGRVVTRPLSLLRDTVDSLVSNTDPDVRVLTPSADLEVKLGKQMNGAVVRLNYNGPDKPEVTIRVENLDNDKAPINERVFPAAITAKGLIENRYNALVLILQADLTPAVLDTLATYRITVTARANNNQQISRATFRVKVVE